MIIESSKVQTAARRTFQQNMSLTISNAKRTREIFGLPFSWGTIPGDSDSFAENIAKAAEEAGDGEKTANAQGAGSTEATSGTNAAEDEETTYWADVLKFKKSLMDMLFELLFKRKCTCKHEEGVSRENTSGGGLNTSLTTVTFGFSRSQSESVSYTAKAQVKTAGGEEIDVDIALNMQRETAEYLEVQTQLARVFLDPLIVNFDGNPAVLTNEKYEFDLDADGILDRISFAGPGSGFLALDKNGDGIINDGNELFGPQTGNGFEELRKYDRDGNGWIDESDDIFSQLRVWSKDQNGNDQLFTLLEADIGAIYLGDVGTEFSIKGDQNDTLGLMRSTSFFLRERGGTGTVSHIDLATDKATAH